MKKSNWNRNEYQFPRFIAEAEAAGAFTDEVTTSIAESMDLTFTEVCDIISRAQVEWEKIKTKTFPVTPVDGKKENKQTQGYVDVIMRGRNHVRR